MTIDVTVDLQTSVSFRHFWRSTGLSPAALLLEPEMHMALALLGSVPRRGIEYVRVHYLLDLVTVDAHGYNFTYLDRALDAIINTHLLPFFELMGNPSERFTDFEDDNQVRAWADFVEETISRYLARYGQDTVRRWYFETWNEPDLAWWQFGDIGLNNYYDACVEGLQRVDPHLRIGGPGTARTLSPRFKQFLAHCDSGINYFTGEVGTRLDFISVHEKGVKSHPEDLTPDTDGICQRELQAVNYIREHHPKFADVPFINNECDPQVGWRQYHSWRGLPYTAAIICKIVAQHQTQLVEGSVDVAPADTSSRAVN
ncbi:MAG: glycosyl hydrolase, partial [Deinococcota bacterium]